MQLCVFENKGKTIGGMSGESEAQNESGKANFIFIFSKIQFHVSQTQHNKNTQKKGIAKFLRSLTCASGKNQ